VNDNLDELLLDMARRYIWWKTPEQACAYPLRVAAQVMNMGDFDDVIRLTDCSGGDFLCAVIREAEPGWFSPRSWHFWHYRLGLAADVVDIPPLPKRSF
jgi:hypothetical protein